MVDIHCLIYLSLLIVGAYRVLLHNFPTFLTITLTLKKIESIRNSNHYCDVVALQKKFKNILFNGASTQYRSYVFNK
jgi:hypothetical protein